MQDYVKLCKNYVKITELCKNYKKTELCKIM
jgi:hypothetical protein